MRGLVNGALAAARRRVLVLRARAYKATFLAECDQPGAAQAIVLADLAAFCRAGRPCWDDDARRHALLEGRREVWLRLQSHLGISERQIEQLTMGADDE